MPVSRRLQSGRIEPSCRVSEARLVALIDHLRSHVFASARDRELFHAIFLDSNRAFLGEETYANGSCSHLSLRMRALFSKALALKARSMIIAHNHPSGDCRPSRNDCESTARLAAMSQALDIQLLDHLIITEDAIYSMRAGGDL